VICISHCNKIYFLKEKREKKESIYIRRRSWAAKKQRNKRWPCADGMCLWRNFFADQKQGAVPAD
jgi:hypothetical protein